ncbi:MAG TPA: membrane protein insertase YidC [Pyrinomonadaceae bacterium]|nr:membrane protein insertase YidC [Pyrinomonadaceae bacterium]
MEQKRLLIAVVISALILFGWSYFFTPKNPQQNANSTESAPTATPAPTPTAQTTPADSQHAPSANAPDAVAQRTLTVSTPLYEVQLDSRGGIARSWVIKQNKEKGGEGKPLYSIASTKDNPQKLELISQEGAKRDLFPLRIFTGRDDLDSALASRNFTIKGVEGDAGDARLDLKNGEQKAVELSLTEPASGVEVLKRLTFDADNYTVKLETKISQGGQPLPGARIAVGPSIGDQGVPRFTYYSIAPEAIFAAGGDVTHYSAEQIDKSKDAPNIKRDKRDDIVVTTENVDGQIQWAGVGDTYFAMTLVLPQPTAGLEYKTEKIPQQVNGQDRYLVTGYVPVPADGTPMYLYTGPKDRDQLQESSELISKTTGRQVDLEQLINYGWTRRITKYLAPPIIWSIKHLNRLTGSYGLAIILFTVIIYMLFFPLKWRSSKSMKKAQKLAPRMKELQEKIKGMKQNDPRLKELQMEQLRLMKEGNPLGGCLPLLIQMPFLIALYVAITISIDFRQASFLWIHDLSAAEPYTIHILPLLMAGSMLVLQLITPAPSADPLQRKMMAVVMPVMMLYILWSAPAGLLVYWLVGNLVGFGQQFLINRMLKSEDDEGQPPQEKDRAGTQPKKKLTGARAT